jgi:hypothetical protein
MSLKSGRIENSHGKGIASAGFGLTKRSLTMNHSMICPDHRRRAIVGEDYLREAEASRKLPEV